MNTLTQTQINLAIADDHVIVREGIANILSSFGRFNIVIKAADGDELIKAIEQSTLIPDICLLDINMPHKNGWDTLLEIKRKWENIKVLILTSLTEKNVISTIIRSGGNGYLCKSCNPEELEQALCTIHEIGYYFPNAHAKTLLNNIAKDRLKITNKELLFLSHCCEDNCYKEIAKEMHVSPRTVEGYRDSLFEKLNVKTRVGLVTYAIRNGIVSFFGNA